MTLRLKQILIFLVGLFVVASALLWLLPSPDRAPAFKRELYEAQRPEIVLVGSARAQTMRGEDFNTTFLNMTGQQKLQAAVETVEALLTLHRPATLIVAVDFWWFNEAATTAQTTLQGEIDSFGATRLEAVLSGEVENPDLHFADSFRRIEKGADVFAPGDVVSEARWKIFKNAIDRWREDGVEVIIFIPPLAPAVIDKMVGTASYGYIGDLRKRLRGLDVGLYDFHDPRFAGGANCEFITGLTGGDIVMARALLYMAARSYNGFGAGVDLPSVAGVITQRAGYASRDVENEIDVLGLGCQRGVEEIETVS